MPFWFRMHSTNRCFKLNTDSPQASEGQNNAVVFDRGGSSMKLDTRTLFKIYVMYIDICTDIYILVYAWWKFSNEIHGRLYTANLILQN